MEPVYVIDQPVPYFIWQAWVWIFVVSLWNKSTSKKILVKLSGLDIGKSYIVHYHLG